MLLHLSFFLVSSSISVSSNVCSLSFNDHLINQIMRHPCSFIFVSRFLFSEQSVSSLLSHVVFFSLSLIRTFTLSPIISYFGGDIFHLELPVRQNHDSKELQ